MNINIKNDKEFYKIMDGIFGISDIETNKKYVDLLEDYYIKNYTTLDKKNSNWKLLLMAKESNNENFFNFIIQNKNIKHKGFNLEYFLNLKNFNMFEIIYSKIDNNSKDFDKEIFKFNKKTIYELECNQLKYLINNKDFNQINKYFDILNYNLILDKKNLLKLFFIKKPKKCLDFLNYINLKDNRVYKKLSNEMNFIQESQEVKSFLYNFFLDKEIIVNNKEINKNKNKL